jgi:hypothetical protein
MLRIKRRDIIRVGALGSAALILGPAEAWATPWHGPALAPGDGIIGELLGLAFDYFITPYLPPDAVPVIEGLFQVACQEIGRAYSVHSSARAAAGGQAFVGVHVSKAVSGLAVHGQMLDSSGKIAMSHDGTAPSHTHPLMKAHAVAIVGKAHSYLRSQAR